MNYIFPLVNNHTVHVPSNVKNVQNANAPHNVRLPHDVMPNPSILDIGTSLVKHLSLGITTLLLTSQITLIMNNLRPPLVTARAYTVLGHH